MNIEQKLVSSVIGGLKALYGQDVPAAQVQLQKTKKEFETSCLHVANRSYLKNPINIRDHLIRLLLRRQKYSLIAHHRLLHRRDGFIPDDIEIYRHLRQHGQSAQRDHRHCQFLIFHNTFIFLNQMYRYFL